MESKLSSTAKRAQLLSAEGATPGTDAAKLAEDGVTAESVPILLRNKKSSPSRAQERKKRLHGALLLDEVTLNTKLEDASNCLEFLLLSLSRSFELSPKQSVGLLTEGGKYLNLLLLNGLRSSFQPVLSWVKAVKEALYVLIYLIEEEISDGALELMLNSMRPGLASKSVSVAKEICDFLVKFHSLLVSHEKGLWEWLVSETTFRIIVESLNTHGNEIVEDIARILFVYGKRNLEMLLVEILSEYYKKPEYYAILSMIIRSCKSNEREMLETQGVVLSLLKFAIQYYDYEGKNHSFRFSTVTLLCEIWTLFPKFVEHQEALANSVLTVIIRASKERSRLLKFGSYAHLFKLLILLADLRSPYAPIILKRLVFGLIESISNERLREFFMYNFVYLLEEFQAFPIGLLIEPLVKQLHISEFTKYNVFDFEFCIAAARHPRLELSHGILLFDLLGKIFIHSFIFSKAAEIPIVLLAGKFLGNAAAQEFLLKLVELGLKVIKNQCSSRSESCQSKTAQLENIGNPLYMRNILFSLCAKLLRLNNDSFNSDLKDLLLCYNYETKRLTGSYIKGFRVILDYFGDSSSLIQSFAVSKSEIVSKQNSEDKTSLHTQAIRGPSSKVLSDIQRARNRREEKSAKQRCISEQQRT